MTIVRCPRCSDEVTLPPRAAGGALVRCPLCLEEYLLAEVAAQVPPALVVISGPTSQTESTAAVEAEPEQEAEYRLEEVGLSTPANSRTTAVRLVLSSH